MEPKEKAKEIYFAILNEGKGMISDHLVECISAEVVNMLNQQAEEIFHKYGIGYMGNAVARNDYKKSSLYKYWKEVTQEIHNIE